jgi:methylenetetrahydrofolate reductase (NADPH)
MKIIDIFNSKSKTLYSFEFFPPKTIEGEKKLYQTVTELQKLSPAFISVTYGAGGSTREKTFEICDTIQNQYHLTTMCHYTCVGSSKDEILTHLNYIQSKKIDNIIALRGDPPKEQGRFIKHPDGFSNASELIEFIKMNEFNFCIAGGCYPEKHPDSPTLDDDIAFLKRKVEKGAEFLITQLFFDNNKFKFFMDKVLKSDIITPIIPGIMPITNFKQIQRFKDLADCSIPSNLIDKLELYKDDLGEFLKYSIEFTVKQCEELLKMGVPGLHFYTLNQSDATIQIMQLLS